MQIVIEIPNKDIPKHQDVFDIRLHFVGGHVVGADGYGFMELPKGHGKLGDLDKIKKEMQNYHDDCAKTSKYTRLGFETAMAVVEDAKTIIEADKAESEE